MDARGLSASDVAREMRVDEATVRNWRSQGVPARRRPHVERYMAEWTDPAAGPQGAAVNVLRIEFDDEEIDVLSRAANIVDTPIREFVRRSSVHQARADCAKAEKRSRGAAACPDGEHCPRPGPAAVPDPPAAAGKVAAG